MSALLILLILAVLFVFSAFFSVAETAVTSADKAFLHARSKAGDRRARTVRRMVLNIELFLGVVLVGNNIVNVSIATLSDVLVARHVPVVLETIVNALLIAPVLLILGEFLPKTLARAHANRVSLLVARPLVVAQWALWPLVWAFSKLSGRLATLVGGAAHRRTFVSRDDLRIAAEIAVEQGVLAKTTGRLLHTALALENRRVLGIVTPLAKATLLPANMTVLELEATHLPADQVQVAVYEGQIENILGVIDRRDVLYAAAQGLGEREGAAGQRRMREFLRQDILQVTEEMTVGSLFQELRYRRASLVIVHDRTGRVAGLITLPDLVKALFADTPPTVVA